MLGTINNNNNNDDDEKYITPTHMRINGILAWLPMCARPNSF